MMGTLIASIHTPADKYHLDASRPVSKMSSIDDTPSTPPIIAFDGSKKTSTATAVAKLAQKINKSCFKLYINEFFIGMKIASIAQDYLKAPMNVLSAFIKSVEQRSREHIIHVLDKGESLRIAVLDEIFEKFSLSVLNNYHDNLSRRGVRVGIYHVHAGTATFEILSDIRN